VHLLASAPAVHSTIPRPSALLSLPPELLFFQYTGILYRSSEVCLRLYSSVEPEIPLLELWVEASARQEDRADQEDCRAPISVVCETDFRVTRNRIQEHDPEDLLEVYLEQAFKSRLRHRSGLIDITDGNQERLNRSRTKMKRPVTDRSVESMPVEIDEDFIRNTAKSRLRRMPWRRWRIWQRRKQRQQLLLACPLKYDDLFEQTNQNLKNVTDRLSQIEKQKFSYIL